VRFAGAPVIVATALALTACGTSDRDQVRDKVDQFVTAAAHKDYRTICRAVLAPTLLGKLAEAGITCEQAMQVALGGVQQPTLSIGKITVSGSSASVIVLSGAQGQQASLETIQLVRTGEGWRISALASPLSS
jgi:hypothetical protein